MSNIASTSISVFPTARRSASSAITSRQISESSVVRIVNSLINKVGFIITSSDSFALTSPYEFNIHGYYFKVNSASAIVDAVSNLGTTIYGNIELDASNTLPELKGQDVGSNYSGIDFSNSASTGTNKYSLLLLERDNTTQDWRIPTASQFRFADGAVEIDIDGGSI